ncbi:MAG: cytochrome P450 [Pseudomonadota bacterium]
MTARSELAYLDLAAPGFSTRGPEVMAARSAHWCAQTPWGLAVLRHAETGRLLRDRRLRQGSRIWPSMQGLSGPFVAFWERSVIGQEGEHHKRLRHLAVPALAPEHIMALEPVFDAIASELADELADEADFMEAFALPFAGRAIAALLGLEPGAWPMIARNAVSLGLAMGIGAAAHEAEINAAYEALDGLAKELVAKAERGEDPGGYAARLLAGATGPGLDTAAIHDLIVITVFGGVDTTRAQLGLAMALFAEHPGQWQRLRADPSLVPAAVDETIRERPTTTWVTREALESFQFEGVEIQAGDILHMLVHASARDPALSAETGFDISAQRRGHFGFGGGAHHCLGHRVARADISAALRALVARFTAILPAGDPTWLPESGNTAPLHLPLRCARA